MRTRSRWMIAALVWMVIGSVVPTVALAQTDDESSDEDVGIGQLYLHVEDWVAQPTGLQLNPATESNPTDPFDTRILNPKVGTNDGGRYRVGYEFTGKIGEFVLTYYSHRDDTGLLESNPGNFVYGESQAFPLYAGVNLDGRADQVRYEAEYKLRDLRLDYYRPAFANDHVRAKWFVGIRRVFFELEENTRYFALLPGLEPLIPPLTNPIPGLDPLPDAVNSEWEYEGRGVGGGLDFEIPLWKERIVIETGVAVAALRGNLETSYRSVTHYYALDDGIGNLTILGPPYTEFGEFIDPTAPNPTPKVTQISQVSFPVGLQTRRSASSAVIEGYLGFRWKAWRELEVFAGFRDVYYDGVANEIRPKNIVVEPTTGAINIQDVTETSKSVTYEGFYGGVAYRF